MFVGKEINNIPRGDDRAVADKLIIGRYYTVKAQKFNAIEHTKEQTVPVRMKLIGLYPFFARFQRDAGYVESIRYWDLVRGLME